MRSRSWVLAGLLSGVITGLAALALVIAFGPEPGVARASPSQVAGPSAATSPTGGSATGAPTTPPGSSGSSPSPSPSSSPAATGTTALHVGQPAPVLVVPQVGGGSIDLATLRGRPVWVSFFAASCTACVQELSLMNGFLARYGSTNLVVLAIAVGDDEGAAANVARQAGATFPFGLDLDGGAQAEWEAQALPTSYWIDRDGVVRDAATGILGAEAMARGLATILPGTDVRP
jgi:peroxiredoxin